MTPNSDLFIGGLETTLDMLLEKQEQNLLNK